MNKHVFPQMLNSACPHDCPSTCALEVEVLDEQTIGRVRGAKDNTYTDGVICAKVARYAERTHHPDRLKAPIRRSGAKGEGQWSPIAWEDALDEIANEFIKAEQKHGSETVWPYQYAGTMGLVQRDSIHRLRHAKKYSKQYDTICITPAWTGFSAATGLVMGPDPREMAVSDCVVIWGTNPVNTQVNVMTHATKARKQRGAKIVAIDIYQNDTMKQADMALCLRPGTDGALACAVMHCLFRDDKADRDYLKQYSDFPEEFESHLQDKTPEWAAGITGLTVEEIEAFAALLGNKPRTYMRLGYGFARSRNGATNMHAATCIAAVQGSWKYEGGGAFHANSEIYQLFDSEIKGLEFNDPNIRTLDQSKIGRVLTGDEQALYGGPPVTAMLIQNTNPVNVAPEQNAVKSGFMRDDLFVAVHEQFMTDTAQLADIVLPATMFMEHDDIYRGGGHQHIILGPKLIDGPPLCRTNLFVIEELAKRLGVADLPGFGKSENELIDTLLVKSGRGILDQIRRDKWIDCQPSFEVSHYINGFNWPDGKFRLKANWTQVPSARPPENVGLQGEVDAAPTFPDHWEIIDNVDSDHPFRMTTSPSRSFLNSTFAETPSSRKREGKPSLMVNPEDAEPLNIATGDRIEVSNRQGAVTLEANVTEKAKIGVLVAEGLHANSAHENGNGINTLTSAEAIVPHGGAAFHDVKVALRKL